MNQLYHLPRKVREYILEEINYFVKGNTVNLMDEQLRCIARSVNRRFGTTFNRDQIFEFSKEYELVLNVWRWMKTNKV